MAIKKLQDPASLYYYCLKGTLEVLTLLDIPSVDCIGNEWLLDLLPAEILSDLMEMQIIFIIRNEKEHKTRGNLKILFTGRLRRATICFNPEDLELLSLRCKNLKELIVVMANEWSFQHFKSILKLTQIEQISVKHCPHDLVIHNAELRSAWPALPKGCCFGTFAQTLLACKSIRKQNKILNNACFSYSWRPINLYVSNIPMNTEDVKVILINCPGIRIFHSNKQLEALYSLYKECHLSNVKVPTYDLKNLDFVNWYTYERSADEEFASEITNTNELLSAIQAGVQLCPQATSVLLKYYFIPVEPSVNLLEPFLNLSYLESLYVLADFEVDEEIGLYSVLEKHGETMKSLELHNFKRLNIDRIAYYCSSLQCLDLFAEDFYRDDTQLEFKELDMLRILRLGKSCYDELRPPCSSWLKLIKSSVIQFAQLTSIEIEPEVFDEMTLRNHWRNLQTLIIDGCHSLRPSHVFNLLHSSNELRGLHITGCKNIQEHHKERLEECVTKNNYDVCLMINPFM